MLHGYNPPHRYLPYLSWTEIADLPDKENTVIVLPTGATEQHGPHLPCAVDTVISAGVVGHALARLPADVPAFAMAPITYGKSEEHLHFPGTVTLSGETLLATMNEVGESVYRAGFRKLLFVNGHGGQPQVMEMCARELRLRHGDFIVVPSFTWRVPHVAGKFLSEPVQNLLSSRAKNAKWMNCRLVLSNLSQFFHNRLFFSNQAKLRSTTQRWGITLNVCSSLRLAICTLTCSPRMSLTPWAKGLPT